MSNKPELEKALKLSLNKRMFELKYISEELYMRARENILRSA